MVTLNVKSFGVYKENHVLKFTWSTEAGMSVSVITYGAIIQSIKVPDSFGVVKDVVLGFDDLEGYVNRNKPYFGATVGRCANRIGNATFEIDGKPYDLASNNLNKHHLHGGVVGFDKVLWEPQVSGNKMIFSYLSKDMEEGYPGDLVTSVAFELKSDHSFHIDYTATTTKKTVINLTNHSYFNLAGHDAGPEEMCKHRVVINADRVTETDSESIPTGGFIDVKGTPFDFTLEKKICKAVPTGKSLFDDNFCINSSGSEILSFVARASHPDSGRYMEVHSDQPGVQFYTGNSLPIPGEEERIGKNGVSYKRHDAFCFETQKYPDAVHHKNFPSTILTPGDVYKHRVVYKFGVYRSQPLNVTEFNG